MKLMYRVPGITWILFAISLLLSSCGFQLRGTGEQAVHIPALYVVVVDNNFGKLSQSIRSALTDNGTFIPADPASAPWSLFLSSERNDRRIASSNSQVSVSKYELVMEVDLRLEAQDGTVLIPTTQLSTERLYEYDSSNLTGSDAEEQLLRQEMRAELVGRILRRVEMTIGNQSTP